MMLFWIGSVIIPIPFWVRWYYGFLRDRTAAKPTYDRKCREHGDEYGNCCFQNKRNWQPWPDGVCATIAVLAGLVWPVIALIWCTMSRPRKTSADVERERELTKQHIADLEAELDDTPKPTIPAAYAELNQLLEVFQPEEIIHIVNKEAKRRERRDRQREDLS